MYKLRRVISQIALTSFAASMLTSASLASSLTDVKGTDIQNEVSVLSGLEIMVGDDTGAFRPNDPIKRSEVAKVGVAVMGLTQTADAAASVSKYPDVDKSHWANGFINVASDQKLVMGDDTGTFRPDDQIKYSEALAIFVRALGYEPQALANGSFPTGYIKTANSIGLTNGLKSNSDSLITRAEVARMAYNALSINLMEQTSYGTNTSYEITNKTLLKDKLSTTLVTGKVKAVGASVLPSQATLSKDEINIDGTIYGIGNVDVRNSLGFTVDAYVKNNARASKGTLLALVPSEGKNDALTVSADMIASIENSSSFMALHYYADAETQTKTIKASITGDAQIIYNGKAATQNKFAVPSEGSITLLDSDGDSKYDTVFVNETVNYVVDQIFSASKKISDKYTMGTLSLDFEDESKTVMLELEGERINLSDLKEWDVITVTKSEDDSLVYATVNRNSKHGKITERDDSHVYIDGEKYKVSNNLDVSLTLGTQGTFYFDQNGKIAAFDGVSAKSTNYAFLEKASLSTGLDKTLSLKLFTKEGKYLTLNTGEKVKVNKRTALPVGEVMNVIGATPQLITFETDSKGNVIEINTSVQSTSADAENFTLNLLEDNVVYRAASSKLITSEANVIIDDSTLIFDLPSIGTSSDYAVRGKDFLSDGALYNVLVYDMTDDYRAGVIIITNSVAKPEESSPIALIEKVTTAKDEDGELIHKVYALSEGKSIVLFSKDDKTFKKEDGSLVTMGDIIQYRKNSADKVDAVTYLFDASQKSTEFANKISSNLTTIYGRVTKKFSDSVNIQVADGQIENYSIKNANVYVYNTSLSKPKVSVGDVSDISVFEDEECRVFLKIFKDKVIEIVVVK